jgi:hypothetical protein
MLQVKREANITFIRSEALGRNPRIVHAFSTRRAERTDFTLGSSSSTNPMIQMNRVRFLAVAGAAGWPIAWLKQVHSGIVRDVDDTSAANEPMEGDASVTAVEGVGLGIQTADCVPILIADRDAQCVAAAHAGWRGTAAGIAESTVRRLVGKFGVDAGNLVVAIGPHVGVCCYEVGQEVVSALTPPFGQSFRGAPGGKGAKAHVNLAEANRQQLLAAGVPDDQIEISSLCTRCRGDLFFSYRREGDNAGRMLAIIGILP